jgi:hypothetical protein
MKYITINILVSSPGVVTMKHNRYRYSLLIIGLAFWAYMYPVTLVYNMRIRRTFTTEGLPGIKKKRHMLATVLPIVYKRNRAFINETIGLNVREQRWNGGSLFNLRYVPSKHWWLEATTGLEHEKVVSKGTRSFTASRTGFDDIALSAGHNWFLKDAVQLVFYGITGFPTRTKITVDDIQDSLVGTRFFSIGAGTEISYCPINSLKKSLALIFQDRYIHFFNRNWDPILPIGGRIQPGNVIDLLWSAQYREQKNIFEAGYNATFFTKQALITNTTIAKSNTFIRNSIYATYNHIFIKIPLEQRPCVIGGGISIAQSKKFDTKIISGWINMSLIF